MIINYFNNQWDVVNDEIYRLSNIIDKLYEAEQNVNEEEKFIAIEEMIRVLKSNGKIILIS